MRSLQCNRSGSVRAQCLARVQLETNALHPRACVYERNAHRSAPTTHRNWELPDIFLALASTMVFPAMDNPKNVMQLCLRPAQDEKPIFCHAFFVIELGAHHIYDDTRFCHNYHHRSVISMTEFFSFGPKCHGCVFLL